MSPTPIEWIPLDERRKATIKKGPHRLDARVLSWLYCSRCGLMALRNEATRLALRQPCTWMED